MGNLMENSKKCPKHIGFSITDICNLKCSMCARDVYLEKKMLYLDYLNEKQLNRIIEFIPKSVESINISAGYGEPLLHPNIGHIIKKLKSKGLSVICFSNATKMDENKIYKILSSKLDVLLISLDSVDEMEFAKIRSNAKLHVIKENIKRFLNYRMNYNSRTKLIITKIIQNYDTIDSLLYFVREISTLDVDGLQIKYSYPMNRNDYILSESDKNVLLKEARNYGLKIESPRKKIGTKIVCPDAWNSLYFDAYGFVRLCCFNYDWKTEMNVYKMSINEIWNSRIFKDWRLQFLQGHPPTFCTLCPIAMSIEEYKKYGGYDL